MRDVKPYNKLGQEEGLGGKYLGMLEIQPKLTYLSRVILNFQGKSLFYLRVTIQCGSQHDAWDIKYRT